MRLLKTCLLFLTALLLGSWIGGILSVAHHAVTGGLAFNLSVASMIGATYVLFAALPAILFGVPALSLLKRLGYSRWPASAFMAVGGGLVGALLTRVTFTGFDTWAALAGGSVGFFMGLFLISARKIATHG